MNDHSKIAGAVLETIVPDYERRLWVRAENVSLMASVGIYKGEKDKRQEIIFNIVAEILEPELDRIGETIDYRTLVRHAEELTQERHFELIETIVCELGRRLIAEAAIQALEIELYKPAAIAPAMASVRYRIAKPRPDGFAVLDWVGR